MPYDESSIVSVAQPKFYGTEMRLSWVSTAPEGTPFQVYVDGRLLWHGAARKCSLPRTGGLARVNIGTVLPGEESIDFSGSLPGLSKRLALLEWIGGTYLDATGNDDVAGFRVYGESGPGVGIDYTVVLATIPAYRDGVITDGYGMGGYGEGGYGKASSFYSWTSGPLWTGEWSFAVTVIDGAGNESPPKITTVQINVPPRPPTFFPEYERLRYSWNRESHVLTLYWQYSPDDDGMGGGEEPPPPTEGQGFDLMGMI